MHGGLLLRDTRYIYHDSGYDPTPEDIEISQIQEAKLREHCFRMRELADMTRHEIVRMLFLSEPLHLYAYSLLSKATSRSF